MEKIEDLALEYGSATQNLAYHQLRTIEAEERCERAIEEYKEATDKTIEELKTRLEVFLDQLPEIQKCYGELKGLFDRLHKPELKPEMDRNLKEAMGDIDRLVRLLDLQILPKLQRWSLELEEMSRQFQGFQS